MSEPAILSESRLAEIRALTRPRTNLASNQEYAHPGTNAYVGKAASALADLLASHAALTAELASCREEREQYVKDFVRGYGDNWKAELTRVQDLLRRTAEALDSVMTMHPCGMEHIPDRECCCIRPAMVSETAVLAELREAGVLS